MVLKPGERLQTVAVRLPPSDIERIDELAKGMTGEDGREATRSIVLRAALLAWLGERPAPPAFSGKTKRKGTP